MLFFFWRWFRNATWLTIAAIAGAAYNEKLISAAALGLVLGVTSVILSVLDRSVQRLRGDAKPENDAPQGAG